MSKKPETNLKSGKDLTKIRTPHTYAIIFVVVLLCWALTFMVPAGKFSVHQIEYTDSNGAVKTRTVLMADTFRYSYNLNNDFLSEELKDLSDDSATLEEMGVDQEALKEFVESDSSTWDQSQLDDLGLTDDVLYGKYGESMYDTGKKLHKTAKVWGTDDYSGFGFMNYVRRVSNRRQIWFSCGNSSIDSGCGRILRHYYEDRSN